MKATFAGGCFWCMIQPFDKLNGVKKVIAGYANGKTKNPTYEEVCSGTTGHYEAVQITYDEKTISYKELLKAFWMHINPLDKEGQFADKGNQYKTAVFYHNEKQKKQAESSKKDYEKKLKKKFYTPIEKFKCFYPAEEYHQDYYKKNKIRYNSYKLLSGRASFLKKWQKSFK